MSAPCKDCADRTINCHSTCAKYLAFKHENDKQREYERRQKRIEYREYRRRKGK